MIAGVGCSSSPSDADVQTAIAETEQAKPQQVTVVVTVTPSRTPLPTNTKAPTLTLVPTDTFVPTDTPIPTKTPDIEATNEAEERLFVVEVKTILLNDLSPNLQDLVETLADIIDDTSLFRDRSLYEAVLEDALLITVACAKLDNLTPPQELEGNHGDLLSACDDLKGIGSAMLVGFGDPEEPTFALLLAERSMSAGVSALIEATEELP